MNVLKFRYLRCLRYLLFKNTGAAFSSRLKTGGLEDWPLVNSNLDRQILRTKIILR
jgi:hypothetical protein